MIYVYKDPNEMLEQIDTMDANNFINFAKRYNIFQMNGTKFYNEMCEKIKIRLDREGLAYDTVRPE